MNEAAGSLTAMDRVSLGAAIADRLAPLEGTLRDEFAHPGRIHSCVVDDVLDPPVCRAIYDAFPDATAMRLRRTLRERKYVTAQMDRHDPLLEEILFAFQQPPVVELLGRVTGIEDLAPDEHLYAGGISVMREGHFLNPHIDNSHDKDRQAYRVLNLLYYVTPDWKPEYGGSLELWDQGPRRAGARTIPSLFNRLVVMGTTRRSWHSVSPITHDGARTCVSNYYFAPRPLLDDGAMPGGDYFHPTSFRGFADEPVKDVALRVDGAVRSAIRKVRRRGVVEPTHVYRR